MDSPIRPRESCEAGRLKAAAYLGKLAKDVEPDEVKVYETPS